MRSHRIAAAATTLAALTTLTVGLVGSPAQAGVPNDPTATTYTVTGGPSTNLTSTNIALIDFDSTKKPVIACSQFNLAGSVTSPGVSRNYGAGLGSLASLTGTCSNNIFTPITVTTVGAWAMAITGYVDGTNWQAKLYDVKAAVTSPGCSFTIGTGAASDYITGTFNDGTQVFTPATGVGNSASTLKISNTPTGFGCFAASMAQGDQIGVSGAWTNTPPAGNTTLTITNP